MRPSGNSLGWTGDQLRALAQVSEGDKLESVDYWSARAPATFRQLLRARRIGKAVEP